MANLWISASLHDLTWGELRAFVAVGKDLPDDAEVSIEYDRESMEPVALLSQIDPEVIKP